MLAVAATAATSFSTGTDSPVSMDSSMRRSRSLNRRRSAGTLSPDCSMTTSPGTRLSAGRLINLPSRLTMARGESMPRMASSAFSALPSWMKPITALISTTPRMTPLSIQWPSSAVTTPAPSST